MLIHHIRNATMIIEANDQVILIDPMLGGVGGMPPLAFFRFKARRNPIAPLPDVVHELLDRVTHCVITHNHPDHLDKVGAKFLRESGIPLYCSIWEEDIYRGKGAEIANTIDYWQPTPFLGGSIEGIPAKHGYGFIAIPMGKVMGYHIELPGQPSLYLASDTIYTEDVHKVLTEYKPDIAVFPAGSAQFDIFQPLMMHMEDMLMFVETAPGKTIANHLEAVNHCPTTREELTQVLTEKGHSEKVWIPEDGE
ncbi:MAG: MBL fold metallo-hydrolase, partial [Bacteroidota bacterium]